MDLKLTALDAEDLDVISAAMQDAVLKVGDIRYLKREKKLALVARRFAWEAEKTNERRLTGLQFARVLAVRSQSIRRGAEDAVLSLLSISFVAKDEPAGTIAIAFSGGATLHLDVECIEAQLADLGPAWETRHRPSHEDSA
ncbi:MAG: DUF2948 family protein [Parvibaculaceae bacterium]